MRGVVLSLENFKRHFYIVGGSRNGKTNLLATIAYYLASPANQKLFPCGLIIIDPHGDLGFQLPMMLKDWENLRVIDPWYVRFGMNPLQLMPYNTSDEKSIQIQDQISQLILILEDILKTDPARATRMTWIFRGALHYLYHFSDDVTFLDLYNLMHDMMVMEKDELREMLRDADIEDDVINKTLEAIITLPEEAFTPVMNRIFNFVVHQGSMASRVFCSRKSTLDWDWMLQPGHVTVIRMEAFNIPEDFRALFTNSFVLKLYFLIQHRAKELEMQGKDPSQRTPVYLCLPYGTRVLAEDGKEYEIGAIVEGKLPLKVWSFNVTTGRLEKKEIVGYHKFPLYERLVEVRTANRKLVCTANHRVYTQHGYKPAWSLNRFDTLYTTEVAKSPPAHHSVGTAEEPGAWHYARRRMHFNPTERECEIGIAPLVGAERVLHVQIFNSAATHGKNHHNQEQGLGQLDSSSIFPIQPVLDKSSAFDVQRREENVVARLDKRNLPPRWACSLVHGRRMLAGELGDADSDQRVYSGGAFDVMQMAREAVESKLLHSPRPAAQPILPQDGLCQQGQVLRADPSVCDSLYAVQAHGAYTNGTLRGLSEAVQAELLSDGSDENRLEGLLLTKVQRGAREGSTQAELDKVEAETSYVYDIDVEDNHNFFADGILVHNCVDEFQTIEKLEALERILSESAKYGLLLGLAHQNMAQLSRRELLQSILANVGLMISFKVSSDDAAVLSKVFGEEWKTVLCEKLRRFEVVTKRTLGDGSSEVVRSMTSLAPPPVHTADELKDFMRSKMNGLYDWAREDRKPVYKDEQEKNRRERKRPWAGVSRYVPMAHLLSVEGKEPYKSTLSYMEAEFYDRCSWAKTTVENSLRELLDLHYVSKTEVVGYVIDGKDAQNNFLWRKPHPDSKDEMVRAKTDLYRLTEVGRERFFPKPVPKSQRAGGRLHRLMMEKVIAEFRANYHWVEADWGERHAKMPDLVVFKPKVRTFHDGATKAARQIWDTEAWDYSGRTAVELETSPRKNKKQVRLNYDKCVKAGFKLVDFRVAYEHQVGDIGKILFDKEKGTYSVSVVQTGLSLAEMKKMVEEEEAKVPVEPWVQIAPGDGVEVTLPVEIEAQRANPEEENTRASEDVKGPLGDLPREAYDRLTSEIWPYYLEHGRPAMDSAYLRDLAMNPNWRDDPIWKAAEENGSDRRQLEEGASRNAQPASPPGEESKPPQKPQSGDARREADGGAGTSSTSRGGDESGGEAQPWRRTDPLRTTIVELVGELQDEEHRQEAGGYRIPFREFWEKLKDRLGGLNSGDDLIGPNGKVVTPTTVGRIVRESTSGKRVVWREGGRTVRGYFWKEKHLAK